jgi:hypothetical protein
MKNPRSLAKKIAAVAAIAGAVVPVALALRKRLKKVSVKNALVTAREAARKVPHQGKPRKARRIARHLAKMADQKMAGQTA